MRKPLKHRIGIYLLLSVIPAFIFFLVLGELINQGFLPDALWIPGTMVLLYLLVALVVGPVLFIWGNTEFKRAYQAAQRYAEQNGWLPITRTQWRSRKRDNVALSVFQAFEKRTYILTIDVDGETTTIDEFETPAWSLQFGDWLWEHLLQRNTSPDVEEVAEQRAQWETTALAIRTPISSPTNPQREYHAPPPPRPDLRVDDTPSYSTRAPVKSKVTAGLLAIFLGWLGVHKFYLGHVGLGILYIAVTLLSLGFLSLFVGIAEGIIYLTKSDEEFHYVYVQERKSMF